MSQAETNPRIYLYTSFLFGDFDFVTPTAHVTSMRVSLAVFGDNEAVIKLIIKGRTPSMRHVSRTHGVDIDWSFDRINVAKAT